MKQIGKKMTAMMLLLLTASPGLFAQQPTQDKPSESKISEVKDAIGPYVKVSGTSIVFYGENGYETKFEVFSITGQLVRTLVVKDMPQHIELQRGCYIIKCSSWTKRVMLK